jgi:hypothetical protein
MKTIWKFGLEITDEQTINIPVPYQLLTVQINNGKPCLWAIVDSEARTTELKIYTYGTGHSMPDRLQYYIGTYQIVDEHIFVFHVFVEYKSNSK